MNKKPKQYLRLWRRIQKLEHEDEGKIVLYNSDDRREKFEELDRLWDDAFVFDPKGRWLTINLAYPYEIDLSRIPDLAALVGWNLHLLGKGWFAFSGEASRQFIERVAAVKGFEIGRHN